jgi:hypothetical protein
MISEITEIVSAIVGIVLPIVEITSAIIGIISAISEPPRRAYVYGSGTMRGMVTSYELRVTSCAGGALGEMFKVQRSKLWK